MHIYSRVLENAFNDICMKKVLPTVLVNGRSITLEHVNLTCDELGIPQAPI
jgi:hypothetical protein